MTEMDKLQARSVAHSLVLTELIVRLQLPEEERLASIARVRRLLTAVIPPEASELTDAIADEVTALFKGASA